MSKKISLSLFIILLFFFKYNICQELNPDVVKAAACISLIKKMDNKNLDQRLVSGYMLSCFVKIDNDKAQKLISSQFSSEFGIDKSEIEKLTDLSELQSKYDQNDIMEFSKQLNEALEELKNANNMGGQPKSSGKGRDKKSSKSSRESSTGLFGFMINGLIGLFNPKDSFLVLIGFFVAAYFLLKGLRKLLAGKKKNDKQKKK